MLAISVAALSLFCPCVSGAEVCLEGTSVLQLSQSRISTSEQSPDADTSENGLVTLPLNTDVTIVHVGKCAGFTIARELKNNSWPFKAVHCEAPDLVDDRFVITLRNPLNRFISAFDWSVEQSYEFNGTSRTAVALQSFGHVGKLAEQILNDTNQDVQHILDGGSHVHWGLDYYLHDLVKPEFRSKIAGVLVTETLEDDMMRTFGIDIRKSEQELSAHVDDHQDDEEDNHISEQGVQNLLQHLGPDYQIIRDLNDAGFLRKEQAEFLLREYKFGNPR